jgi:hypothetical protein
MLGHVFFGPKFWNLKLLSYLTLGLGPHRSQQIYFLPEVKDIKYEMSNKTLISTHISVKRKSYLGINIWILNLGTHI